MSTIDVHFTLTRHNEPTVILIESPLTYRPVEVMPQQLREIAALLVMIANDSEMLGLNPGEERRSYLVGE